MMDTVSYLLTCSEISRDAFVLAKLDLAARLRKQVGQLLNEWIEAEAQALLGDMIREAKRTTIAIESTVSVPEFLQQRRRLE